MNEFFQRLKERKLVQWAIAYVAAAFALLQGIDIVAQQFGWPEGVRRGITLGLVVGFFVTLVLAWYHGERGAQRVTGTELLIIGLVLALGGGFLWRFAAASRTPDNKTAIAPNESRMPEPAAVIPEKSIAVLPFENLSSDKENAYFTDGVQDEILTDLAKIADLKVISRTSVMQYKSGLARNLRKIGEELGVAHVVEGSVQRAANKVRVNAQLIDARNDAHLWAQTYDRDLADVFAIQSEIAKAIADQLQAKILPREKVAIEARPTNDITAYDLYIQGVELVDAAPNAENGKDSSLQGVSLLEQAIARDAAFLPALCTLAQAHDQLYLLGFDHTSARLSLAEQAINAALRLQPDAAEAHLALAHHLYSKLDYEGARRELELVRSTLPNDARQFELSGYIDRRKGRWQDAARNLERALELDPNNVFILGQIASSYECLREYSREAAALDRVLAIRPNDLDTRVGRAQLEVIWKADTRPLHRLIELFMQQNPTSGARLAPVRIFLASAERDP